MSMQKRPPPFADPEVLVTFELSRVRTELLGHAVRARAGLVLEGEAMRWSWLVLPSMPDGDLKPACPHARTEQALSDPSHDGDVDLVIRCLDCGRALYRETTTVPEPPGWKIVPMPPARRRWWTRVIRPDACGKLFGKPPTMTQ